MTIDEEIPECMLSIIGEVIRLDEVDYDTWDAENPVVVYAMDRFVAAFIENKLDYEGIHLLSYTEISLEGVKNLSNLPVSDDVSNFMFNPFLLFNGRASVLAWDRQTADVPGSQEIFIAMFSPGGEKLGNDIKISNDNVDSVGPALAFNYREYAIVWCSLNGEEGALQFQLLDIDGNPLGNPTEVARGHQLCDLEYYILYIDDSWIVIWSLRESSTRIVIYFSKLFLDGSPNGEPVSIISDSRRGEFAVSATDMNLGIVWDSNRDGMEDIYYTLISPEGSSLVDEVKITHGLTDSVRPKIVWSGSEFGVAWRDDESSTISFTRLSLDGERIGTEISIGSETNVSYNYDTAATDSDYVFVWDNFHRVFFAKVGCY